MVIFTPPSSSFSLNSFSQLIFFILLTLRANTLSLSHTPDQNLRHTNHRSRLRSVRRRGMPADDVELFSEDARKFPTTAAATPAAQAGVVGDVS